MIGTSERISVLLLHNRYRLRGGEDVMFEAEADLLERHGHRVERFVTDSAAIRDPASPVDQVRLAAGTVWSRDAARQVRRAIRQFRPDVVHAHNTFPLLSPSVYEASAREGVPMVHTLHNFRLLCPASTLFRDGRPCTDCVGRPFAWPGIAHACYQDSRQRSAVIAAMTGLARLRGSLNHVTFIALNEFARDLFVQGGLNADRIHVKPNFLEPDPGGPTVDDGAFVYAGRLSTEKGIELLLEAWRRVPSGVHLRVLGDGPLRERVEVAAAALSNVHYHGAANRAAVMEAMKAARAVLVPSEWFEMAPVAVLEAFGCGSPVIASRLGALEHLVRDGEYGLLFAPGHHGELADRVLTLHASPELAAALGAQARNAYLERYRGDTNYPMLIDVYRSAIAKHGGRGGG